MEDIKNLLYVTDTKVESNGIRLFFHALPKPVNIMFLESYEQKDLILSTSLIYHIPKQKNNVFLQTYRTVPRVYEDLILGKVNGKIEEDLISRIPMPNEPFAKIIQILD